MDLDGVASTSDSEGEVVSDAEDANLVNLGGPEPLVAPGQAAGEAPGERAGEVQPDPDELQDTFATLRRLPCVRNNHGPRFTPWL